MDSSFLNLSRGARLQLNMGLRMLDDNTYDIAKDYSFIEIPIFCIEKDGEQSVDSEVKRNQYVKIVSACTVTPGPRDHVLVEPNPALSEFGLVQAGYYMHGGDSGTPGFMFQARKDTDLSQLKYAVRLYLRI